ncbi:hypothetical protein Tco_1207178, partial [Tanacetum coccineum]
MPMTLKKAKLQIYKAKRLADLKSEREKSEKTLRRWVATTAGKLEIPPIPQLMPFEISLAKKKRKRKAKVLHEVFVKENIMVDGTKRNLVPTVGAVGSVRLVIKELEAGIFVYNGSF